jgi:hypothetical protein
VATLLHRALKNIRWRIESIDTTADDICQAGFAKLDPSKTDQREGSALERRFTVTWLGRGPDLYVTDRSGIDSMHQAQVMVLYWPGRGWDEAQELLARDQFDIAQALRNDSNYVGISADDPTDPCGIISRTVDKMTLDIEGDPWSLTIALTMHMQESA